MMLADDDLDVDADFARTAENFDHASCRCESASRIARDFDVDDRSVKLRQANTTHRSRPFGTVSKLLPQFGSQLFAWRNRNFMRNARVVGQNDVAVRSVAEQADDRHMFALDDLHDAAFRSAVGAPPLDARQDVIAVHRVAQIVAANEQVAVHARDWMVGDEKAVPIAVRDDAAGDQIRIARTSVLRGSGRFRFRWRAGLRCAFASATRGLAGWFLLRQAEASAVDFLDIAAALQLLDNPREVAPPGVLQIHAVRDLPDTGGLRLLGKVGDHFRRADWLLAGLFILDGVLASHG